MAIGSTCGADVATEQSVQIAAMMRQNNAQASEDAVRASALAAPVAPAVAPIKSDTVGQLVDIIV